jgi:hypothetical protein
MPTGFLKTQLGPYIAAAILIVAGIASFEADAAAMGAGPVAPPVLEAQAAQALTVVAQTGGPVEAAGQSVSATFTALRGLPRMIFPNTRDAFYDRIAWFGAGATHRCSRLRTD